MSNTLLHNADWIITMDEKRTKLRHADILFEDNKIVAVGPDLSASHVYDEKIDAQGMIIIPGLINTHHHCWQSLVRNIHVANGLTLEPWLAVVYEIFQEITPDVVEAGAYVGLGALLKTGCTTSMDHHYAHPRSEKNLIDVQIKAAQKLGIRFHPTRGSMSISKSEGSHVPDSLAGDIDDILADSERLIQTYHDPEKFSMVRMGLAPCWHEFDSKKEVLDGSVALAHKYKGVKLHTHLAESRAEVTRAIEKYGCRPVEHMRRIGWLGEEFYFAHCVQLNDEEVALLAQTKSGVAHCPASNMFLNSGVCRVSDLLAAGGRVGLGVDGAASNNASDMIGEMRISYLANRLQYGYNAPTAEQILEIATIGGARVLGREDDLGSIEVGKAADLVLLNWDQLDYAGGKNDPIAMIVESGDSRMVDMVFVNGRMVVKQGELLTVDEKATRDYVNTTGKDMLSRAAARVPGLEIDCH